MRFASRALLLHTIKKRAFTFAVSLFLFLSFSLSLWIYDPNFLCPAAPPPPFTIDSNLETNLQYKFIGSLYSLDS